MNDAIITVDNLSKSYRLQHQSRERYSTLRDLLASKVRGLFSRTPATAVNTEEEFWALKDVSFEIKQGEVVGIIGRNGAGKSTLLKILSRITEPTTGRIRLAGRVASLLEVGTGFHPELTGRENIFLNGAILGMNRQEIRRKFDEIVDFAEVETFLDTPVKRYSSGMYVRLAFAVAAHLEPEILIVDEVLAVGDAAFQKKCLGKMREVSGSGGRTVLFVSHNLTAVRSLCNRSILLRAGEVTGDAPTEEVLRNYQGQDLQKSLRRTWRAPTATDPLSKVGVYLKEALIHSDDTSHGTIRVDTAFTLKFCVHSNRDAVVNLSPHFLGAGGEVIFAAPSPQSSIRRGDNWFACQMPDSFLNDDVYAVQLMIVENGSVLQSVNEALVFEVHDLPRTGAWLGKWPGVIRPVLEWQFGH